MGAVSDEGDDVEMLYRLAALRMYVTFSPKNGYRIKDYRNSTKDMLDRFAEESFSLNEKEIAKYVSSIKSFISILDISRKYFSKVTLLEDLYVVFEKRHVQCKITDEICREILAKDFFKASTSGGTISMTNMNKRWKGIYGVLSKYDE